MTRATLLVHAGTNGVPVMRDAGQPVQWHEPTIAVEIARYTATDAIMGRSGFPGPPLTAGTVALGISIER
jgi:hypothetical protein